MVIGPFSRSFVLFERVVTQFRVQIESGVLKSLYETFKNGFIFNVSNIKKYFLLALSLTLNGYNVTFCNLRLLPGMSKIFLTNLEM